MPVDITRADRLCRLFCNVLDDVITPRALEAVSTNGLSRSQFSGLQYVYLHPSCCIKNLAEGLGMSHPAAVKLVERLEARGLISRSACERDRRMVELRVTAKGGKQARAIMRARNQHIERLLSEAGESCSCDILQCLEVFVRCALKSEKDVAGVCLRCGGSHDDNCPVCQAEFELTGELRRDPCPKAS